MKKSLTLAVAVAIALFGALPAGAQEEPVENELSVGFNEETGELNFGFGQDLKCDELEGFGAEDESAVDTEEVAVDDDPFATDDDDASSEDDDASSDDDDASSEDDDASSDDDDASSDDDDASSDDDDASAEKTDEDAEPLDVSVCNIIDVTGPNGQLTHGTVVSSFVHALKDSTYDGKLGHLVRDIAKSDFGKGEKEADAEGEESKKGKKDSDKGKPADAGSKGKGKGKNK